MIVTIPVALNVKAVEDIADDELTEGQAKDAAFMAVWDYITFTETGMDTVDVVQVHVDGFGLCRVRLVDDQ